MPYKNKKINMVKKIDRNIIPCYSITMLNNMRGNQMNKKEIAEKIIEDIMLLGFCMALAVVVTTIIYVVSH